MKITFQRLQETCKKILLMALVGPVIMASGVALDLPWDWPGPNSIHDRHGINQGLPPIEQMPPATNIRIRIGGGN